MSTFIPDAYFDFFLEHALRAEIEAHVARSKQRRHERNASNLSMSDVDVDGDVSKSAENEASKENTAMDDE